MTDTKKDGEQSNTSKDREKAESSNAPLKVSGNGEQKKAQDPVSTRETAEKANPSIEVDKDQTFMRIQIPFSLGIWKAMGFVYEVMIPTVRRLYLEKAQKEAIGKKLLSPPRGFRGFNPKKFLGL